MTKVNMQQKTHKFHFIKWLWNRALFFLLLIVVIRSESLPAQIMTVRDLLAIPPTPADYKICYGNYPYQFGELRLPEGAGPHPVLIIIHGGCWLAEYDLQHISPLATELTKAGFATWSLEYRRLGNEGGGWPGTFQDVALGADFIKEIAKKHPLDLKRIIALGHSAGGHLVLWLAARPRLPKESLLYKSDPLALQGVISLAGIADLSRPEFQVVCGNVVPELMGGKPSDFPERYAQGSPRELLPLHVPQILIQGAKDPTVSLSSAEDYYATAKASGDKVRLVVIQEAGHFELVIPFTSAWPEVRKAVLSLVE